MAGLSPKATCARRQVGAVPGGGGRSRARNYYGGPAAGCFFCKRMFFRVRLAGAEQRALRGRFAASSMAAIRSHAMATRHVGKEYMLSFGIVSAAGLTLGQQRGKCGID